ncbi:type I secretion system permease/ATPase [Endozoicomonas sp. SCSIO W0465]|uniref:type I secretion system permease/ATPase n=1 Tax=Endozoicomonas sp. SCSIO W0465 TaxID=2918516 RepID=UPI002074DC5C|nr:type I secretion system permease/ATPase [Endozoicomonas sp. SCSIO W0465]USE37011.1 type I secretion system permease/ATPase [Endozoicomonas sp. SCSIO W0465]
MNQSSTVHEGWDIPDEQPASSDDLLECLTLLTRHYGNPYSRESLKAGLPLENGQFTAEVFIRASERAGLACKVHKKDIAEISSLVVPAVLLLNKRKACLLTDIDHSAGTARLIMPETGEGTKTISFAELEAFYSGYVIYVREKHRYDRRTPQKLNFKSRHWFWGTILGSWRVYRDVLLASLLINVFVIASPLFVMNVYDRVVPNQAFDTLWVLAIGTIIVFSFDFILKMVRSYFIDLAGKKSDILLSSTIMEQVLGLSMKARPASVGSFAKNLQDFESIREFITSSTVMALVDLPFTCIILFVIFMLGGPVAIIPLVAMIIIGLYSFIIQEPLKQSIDKTLRSNQQKNATLIESLAGMEALKIAQAESDVQYKWEKSVSHIATWSIKTKLLSASATSFSAYVQQMANVGMVILGVYLISEGELSMGGLIASVMLSGRCLAPMAQIAGLATRYNQSKSALDGLNQIMEMPIERHEDRDYVNRPDLKGSIEFDAVNFAYPEQEIKALRDININISVGEKVAIIGRIGSGKTTIEKLIMGLYEPDEGAVRIDGIDLRQINPTDLRSSIGCVSQDITLFYGSIKDNITLGASHVEDSQLLEAAEIAGVTEFANKHPNGLDMVVGERGQNLSGGQRQSIALARALLMNPPIMVMDEPSSSMDNTTELRMKGQLKTRCRDKTLILVTHKASMLDLVDRLIVMDNGRVVADGPKDQVHAALKQGKLKIG